MPIGIKKLTPKQFAEKSEDYFNYCLDNDEPPTSSGLAWHCGFKSRQSLWDYKQDKKYSDIVQRALLFIEYGYEKQMALGRGDGGIVFALKNFGWSDKQEVEQTVTHNAGASLADMLTGGSLE